MNDPGATVSLVLGSGGARGLAHIGVIEWLEAHGYRIRSVSGSSAGALVGGVYAAGRLDDFTRWVTALTRVDVIRLLDLSFRSTGLFKGERVMGVISDFLGDRLIEELPISFTAVATDLLTGREVWFDQGPLSDAVRASIAIPTFFTPHVIEGRQYVDGGLVNPVPMGPTARDSTDLVVAVNVTSRARPGRPDLLPRRPAPPSAGEDATYRSRIARFVRDLTEGFGNSGGGEEPEEEPDLGLFDVVTRSMDAVQHLVARLQLAVHAPDVLIEIPRDACVFYEMYRAREMIDLGRRAAERAFHEMER